MADTDVIMRAYAKLKSLKSNLPTNFHLHEKHINKYHVVVTSLEKEGHNLSDFKIPDNEIKSYITDPTPLN